MIVQTSTDEHASMYNTKHSYTYSQLCYCVRLSLDSRTIGPIPRSGTLRLHLACCLRVCQCALAIPFLRHRLQQA